MTLDVKHVMDVWFMAACDRCEWTHTDTLAKAYLAWRLHDKLHRDYRGELLP